jgi:hypothetical protein
MKMIDYFTKSNVRNSIYGVGIASSWEGLDNETNKVVDRFYYLMQHATGRLDIYNALNEALIYSNISVDVSGFNDCIRELLDLLPNPVQDFNGYFREYWDIDSTEAISKEISPTLENRVAKLEQIVKEIQLELKPNYGGRM